MGKVYYDEWFIKIRNEIKQQEEDLKRLDAQGEDDILNGHIFIGGEEWAMEERLVREGLYMLLPERFIEMSEEMQEIKYPLFHSGDFIIYANEDATTSLVLDFKAMGAEHEDIGGIKDQSCRMYQETHPDQEILWEGLMGSYLSPVGYFSFLSPSRDGHLFNLAFFFSLKGQLAMGNFNCLETEYADWGEAMGQMLAMMHPEKWEVGEDG